MNVPSRISGALMRGRPRRCVPGLLLLALLIIPCCGGKSDPSGAESTGSRATSTPPPPEDLRQDPKALTLLDRADASVYSPLKAGLKDVSYDHTFSNIPQAKIEIRWTRPNKCDGRLAIDRDADQNVQNWARTRGNQQVRRAIGLAAMVAGVPNRTVYENDQIILVDDNTVRVDARSEESRNLFTSNTINFDARGLATTSRSEFGDTVTELAATYKDGPGGLSVVDYVDVTRTTGGKASKSRMQFEYTTLGAYTFITRIDATSEDGEQNVQQFENIRPDLGIKAEELR